MTSRRFLQEEKWALLYKREGDHDNVLSVLEMVKSARQPGHKQTSPSGGRCQKQSFNVLVPYRLRKYWCSQLVRHRRLLAPLVSCTFGTCETSSAIEQMQTTIYHSFYYKHLR